MIIAELLKRREPRSRTVLPEATLAAVAGALEEEGAVIVSRDGVHLDGLLSARDVAGALCRFGPYAAYRSVAEVMPTDEPDCASCDRVEVVAALMDRRRSPHVAVVDNGVVKGVVSARDIIRVQLQEQRRESDALRAYIAA